MSKIDDMLLFVRVVEAGGLAAAGRQLGLSPASMTARINNLEKRYETRLLQRTTRSLSLTEAGQRSYDACLRVSEDVAYAEALLHKGKTALSGRLSITAPSDFGREYVAPAIAEFTQLHPQVTAYLHLTDTVENLIEQRFDVGIRFGNLPDSSLIVKPLADNHRVLVAAPSYLQQHGTPNTPDDLHKHRCLVLEQRAELLNAWQFINQHKQQTINVSATLASSDGAVIRQWAIAGLGIAYKSIWDVKNDINAGRLHTLLDGYAGGFQTTDSANTRLQLVYPNRKYVPVQVERFMHFFQAYLQQ